MTAIRINPESLEQDGTVTLPGIEKLFLIKLLILKIHTLCDAYFIVGCY